MLTAVALVLLGIVVLVLGGEGTVRGGSALASRFNVPPFVVGATVVAFGTSAPELAVTITAATQGAPGLALGNVVGSNIANLGLILGLAAVVTPLTMSAVQVRRETPVVLGVLALLLLFAFDRTIAAWEGIVLLVGMTTVIVSTIIIHRRDDTVHEEQTGPSTAWPLAVGMTIVGLVGLFFGGRWLVAGAVSIAEMWGMPEWVIGVVIVAVGTSMPEAAASVVAAVRGRGDIALGNVLGSNTFNVLMVLGVGSVIKPIHVKVDITADLIVASALTLLPGISLFFFRRIPRWIGFVLLITYAVYLTFEVING